MSFLARLFSSPKVIETTVDGVYNGIDKAFFTDEERSEAAAAAREIYQKLWLAAVPSAVSRRVIACSVVAMWCLVLITMLSAKAAGADEFAVYAAEAMQNIVQNPFNIIVGFYFLTQVVGTLRNGK